MLILVVDSLVFKIQMLVSLHLTLGNASHCAEADAEEDAQEENSNWKLWSHCCANSFIIDAFATVATYIAGEGSASAVVAVVAVVVVVVAWVFRNSKDSYVL